MQSISLPSTTAKNQNLELLTSFHMKTAIQKFLISTLKSYHQLQKAFFKLM